MSKKAILIMGPTASGKSGLAMELARRFDGEIVSVDSAQVYRGMDIGTAKPDQAAQAAVPHHLIDILDPSQSYSAAAFRTDALEAMNAIHERGRVPILAGGTVLYFHALTQGISPLPPADARLRAELEKVACTLGTAALHQRLAEVDEAAAARIHRNDPQRLIRALEVASLTGEPITRRQGRGLPPTDWSWCPVVWCPHAREILHQRVKDRFETMIEAGLVDEVRRLHERADLSCALPALRAVGYRQIWQYLEGALGYDEMIRRATAATRQLAKRQLTWLRRDWGAREGSGSPNEVIEQVEQYLMVK